MLPNRQLGFVKAAASQYLTMILAAIKDIQIKQHIVEEEYVATVFDMETTDGIDRVFDRIRVLDGELKEIHSFYHTRPLQTNGWRKNAALHVRKRPSTSLKTYPF
jgi:hypothetical protein